MYSIRAPDSLFVDDKFPVTVELQNSGFDAHDVKLSIIPLSDLSVIDQNVHTLNKLEAGAKSAFVFELEVPEGIDKTEKKLLQAKVSYSDDTGNNHESTETFPLLVRPRGFLNWSSWRSLAGPILHLINCRRRKYSINNYRSYNICVPSKTEKSETRQS